ncbi:Nramp family divalent metal transporter [Halosegnis sp.]|uniref:Nramp family divalent metal transporter n=1 Tax=Halosegnis sp. TaxID=2864959 RepID=UPI0035D5255B
MPDESDGTAEPDGGVITEDDDVYTTAEVGEKYRDTVYRETDYDSLEDAPQTAEYPSAGKKEGYKLFEMPKVPKVSHIVGPSAIMLGASLGSGETMFWPTLVAEYGWFLYWAFWVGVITQFFINTELQRWTMATGESIFRAYDRIHRFWPYFFLVAGLFHLGWPGWASGASEVFASWTGIVPRGEWWIIAVVSMALIWLSYQAGPVVYNIIEKAQIGLMILAVGFAVLLAFVVGSAGQLANVPAGAVSFGALPPQSELDIATFLGGLAYAGAGGYINLSQGVWSREKGYGMGTYQGRVKNPLRGAEPEEVQGGFAFEPTEINLKRWRGWWKVTQQEHFLTFVVGLLVVATIAMTISVEYAAGNVGEGAIDMWIGIIIPQLNGLSATLLYAVIFIALFSTQYAIVESFVRNSVDIVYQVYGRSHGVDESRLFLGVLTLFTLWGIGIILLSNAVAAISQPWILLVIGAAIAGVMMWPYNALTIILNTTKLPEHAQPGWARVVAMWWATGFFGFFSVLLIGGQLSGPVADAAANFGLGGLFESFAVQMTVVGSQPGGYLLWVAALAVQVYTMYRSARAKLDASGTVDGADEASGLLA